MSVSSRVNAAKTYRVQITSEPAGATVWIDDRTGQPAGRTPLSTRLSAGAHTIYVELDGYESVTWQIRVKRRRKQFNVELTELKTGSILVLPADGNRAADEAKVLLDGKEVGTVPDSFDVAAGTHEIEVVRQGFEPFKKTVEVTTGQSVEVLAALVEVGKKPGSPLPTSTRQPPPDLRRAGPAPARISPLSVGASVGAAYRYYKYVELNRDIRTLRPFEGPNLGMVELTAELRLGGLVSWRWLRPFSIFATASLNLPTRSSSNDGNENISTTWFRRDVGLRTKFSFGLFWLAIDLAQAGDRLDFPDDAPFADDLPELSYETLRLGVLLGLAIGNNEFGVGGDGLLALSVGGIVDEAFADDDVYGFRVHAWYRRHLPWNLAAALHARFVQFAHTFTAGSEGMIADGAYDRMFEVLVNVAYQF
ncbi:MAG: PEGA domain-containing protein [Proteobacteria bacterium]|nr:PEGA domain-containing protein [Pseudomonadota bacterium]